VTTTDPNAAAELWTKHVVMTKLAREATGVVGELERATGHARELLADARMSEPPLAGMRARLLSSLVAAGAVAVDRAEEG
jgi:hypothetical protein